MRFNQDNWHWRGKKIQAHYEAMPKETFLDGLNLAQWLLSTQGCCDECTQSSESIKQEIEITLVKQGSR